MLEIDLKYRLSYKMKSGPDPERTCDLSKFQVNKNVGGRWKNFLILEGLKHSSSASPCLRYNAKVDNDFD